MNRVMDSYCASTVRSLIRLDNDYILQSNLVADNAAGHHHSVSTEQCMNVPTLRPYKKFSKKGKTKSPQLLSKLGKQIPNNNEPHSPEKRKSVPPCRWQSGAEKHISIKTPVRYNHQKRPTNYSPFDSLSDIYLLIDIDDEGDDNKRGMPEQDMELSQDFHPSTLRHKNHTTSSSQGILTNSTHNKGNTASRCSPTSTSNPRFGYDQMPRKPIRPI